ncbi:MAG: hypothetical protein RBU45_20925 [Myxococcota bacterium]|jgi:hypothetical protein|nr:hypothetical protein [Myxococcota bacterium]
MEERETRRHSLMVQLQQAEEELRQRAYDCTCSMYRDDPMEVFRLRLAEHDAVEAAVKRLREELGQLDAELGE